MHCHTCITTGSHLPNAKNKSNSTNYRSTDYLRVVQCKSHSSSYISVQDLVPNMHLRSKPAWYVTFMEYVKPVSFVQLVDINWVIISMRFTD